MKQVTLQIPDNKFSFIVELLDQLGIKDVHENDLYIPEWHKEIIRNRMADHKPENAIELKQFEAQMKKKYGA